MSEDKKVNKEAQGLLSKLKVFFKRKKEIKCIKVCNGTQTFWVNNPKKIDWWMGFANNTAANMLDKVGNSVGVKILKVVYKEDGKSV